MTAQPPTPAQPASVLPAAVLWDMDGTIIDTEPIWQESQVVLTARYGAEWTHQDGLSLVGSGLERSGEILRDKGVDLEVEEIVQWMTDFVVERLHGDDLPWRPGARELVEELHDRGIPTALVTMSRRTMALVTAEAFGARGFRVVVAGDDVDRPKPHPDAYLTAAAQLGVEPTACVAIEDSATGVASARASGAVTVAVEHIVPIAEGASDVHLTTLSGVDVDRLLELTGPALSARAAERQGGPTSVPTSAPAIQGDAR
ncbi:HAD family phosphatase [Curtobacterium sp. MCPF17_031]|uniref:HAD family hydrolase n=1 Tax=Curtobacterium sp. MCPF17_031 TaxID=2175653 RepID=UPI0021ABEF87|nr:HAD family hydrolase [Curtobacterium sp. MCPF17_031]